MIAENQTRRVSLRSLALLLVLSGAAVLQGCAVAAYLNAMLTPPETIDAKFEIPKHKTILVLVDDPAYRINYAPVKIQLSKKLSKELTDHNIAMETIPYSKLQKFAAARHRDYNHLSNSEIGKALGADLVLNIQVTNFSLKDSPNSPIWTGRFTTQVKIIDVEEGRLWPDDSHEGRVTATAKPDKHEMVEKGQTIKIANELAKEMAETIAKLFYAHEGKSHFDLPESPNEDY